MAIVECKHQMVIVNKSHLVTKRCYLDPKKPTACIMEGCTEKKRCRLARDAMNNSEMHVMVGEEVNVKIKERVSKYRKRT